MGDLTRWVDPQDSRVFHRELDRQYPVMVGGRGCYLIDADGRDYLDGVGGGACVTVIGYGNQHVLQAAAQQMAELPFAHNQKYTNRQQERLAERLTSHSPSGINHAFFVQGGAEANEAALRLIRKYHVDRGAPERDIVVTQRAAYHGSTVATLALTGRPTLHHPVEPWLPPFRNIAPFHCWRCPYGLRYGSCGIECARVLQDVRENLGTDRIAAFMMETIPTSAAPGLVPPPEFLPLVREWCDEVGALLVLDEVVTGMGRTGKWFATDYWDVVPDALTTAKGLGGGYTPIGALLVHDRVYETIAKASREFEHGHTLNGNPVSCAIANAVLDVIEERELVPRSRQLGAWIRQELAERLVDLEVVGEVRGLGTLIGIEYVKSRKDRAFLDPKLRFGRAVELAALDEGLSIYGTQHTREGYVGDGSILAPPYVLSDAEAEVLVDRLERAIRLVTKELAPEVAYSGEPISLGHSPPQDRA